MMCKEEFKRKLKKDKTLQACCRMVGCCIVQWCAGFGTPIWILATIGWQISAFVWIWFTVKDYQLYCKDPSAWSRLHDYSRDSETKDDEANDQAVPESQK